jgi:hypothetical protein
MLPVEIIIHLNGHITIDHETHALVRNSQAMNCSSKFFLPSSFFRGIDVQAPERLCDILYSRIPVFFSQDSEGFGRNSIVHHDQVSDADVAMKIALLDKVEPPYQHVGQVGTRAKSQDHIPRQAWNTARMSVFALRAVTND